MPNINLYLGKSLTILDDELVDLVLGKHTITIVNIFKKWKSDLPGIYHTFYKDQHIRPLRPFEVSVLELKRGDLQFNLIETRG